MGKQVENFRVAIAGVGTVGASLLGLIAERNKKLSSTNNARPIEVVAVAARDKNKKRSVDLGDYQFFSSAVDMARTTDYDAMVELIGGANGVTADLWRTTIWRGKPIITANKALISERAKEFIPMIEKQSSQLHFEAAVMGGVPIIDTLKHSLRNITLHGFHGIVNGTCNYILTSMAKKNINFATALQEAQDSGYAEADPSFDIDGVDALHKLVILAMLAFQVRPDSKKIPTVGIRAIDYVDIQYAALFGFKIKLLAVAQKKNQRLSLAVAPMLVKNNQIMAKVGDALNAIHLDSEERGALLLIGKGAGGMATASAVLADIISASHGAGNNKPSYPFGVPFADINRHGMATDDDASNDANRGRFYLRINADDKVGVMAAFSSVLRDEGISIEKLYQNDDHPVHIVIITHPTTQATIERAVEKLAGLDTVLDKPVAIKILER